MSRGHRSAGLDRPCRCGRGAVGVRFRRIFLLTAGSGKGPLPEPTTAVRRQRRDRRRHLDRRLSRLGLLPNKPAEGQLEGGRGLNEVLLEMSCKTSVASEQVRSTTQQRSTPYDRQTLQRINQARGGLYRPARILVVQAQLTLLPTRKEAARRMLSAAKRARSRVPLTGLRAAGQLVASRRRLTSRL